MSRLLLKVWRYLSTLQIKVQVVAGRMVGRLSRLVLTNGRSRKILGSSRAHPLSVAPSLHAWSRSPMSEFSTDLMERTKPRLGPTRYTIMFERLREYLFGL